MKTQLDRITRDPAFGVFSEAVQEVVELYAVIDWICCPTRIKVFQNGS